MFSMKYLSAKICAISLMLIFVDVASAQVMVPGGSQFSPPPPLSPKIEPPIIPQMDASARPNYVSAPRPSFSDRIIRCLDEAAAAGLGPNERAAYSRSCANQGQ